MLKLPKEHGAWAMLYVPFFLGLLVADAYPWRVALLWLTITAVFIGRDALANWGNARQRGQESTEGSRALNYGIITLLAGAPLVLLDRLLGLVPIALLASLALWWHYTQTLRRAGRTIISESLFIAGVTVTGPAAYYVAGATIDATAGWIWFVSLLYFASSVFYVKQRVLATQQRKVDANRAIRLGSATYHTLVAVIIGVLVWAGVLHWLAFAALGTAIIRAGWFLARPAGQLKLVRIGVLEIAYSLNFLIFGWLAFKLV